MYMPNASPNARRPNATYIPLTCVGISRWVIRKFQVWRRWRCKFKGMRWLKKILASLALPNANPRRQVFCVAVEYRLYSCHLTQQLSWVNRLYQPRGENEVRYQHKCRARPECRDRRSARGSGPTRVLILTQVQSPRGWYCIYQIFQHLNRALI